MAAKMDEVQGGEAGGRAPETLGGGSYWSRKDPEKPGQVGSVEAGHPRGKGKQGDDRTPEASFGKIVLLPGVIGSPLDFRTSVTPGIESSNKAADRL